MFRFPEGRLALRLLPTPMTLPMLTIFRDYKSVLWSVILPSVIRNVRQLAVAVGIIREEPLNTTRDVFTNHFARCTPQPCRPPLGSTILSPSVPKAPRLDCVIFVPEPSHTR